MMTTPATFAEWARRAKPGCPYCHGTGAARYRQQDSLSVGERIMRGLAPPRLGTFESGCKCLASAAVNASKSPGTNQTKRLR